MKQYLIREQYDIAVIGAGHAGCEAALASARLGLRTLVLCIDLDSVALMACNPSIGGTSKGHLVREVDALGGEMGLAADDCFIQMRMLNTGKGPAVHSLRAQMDKRRYHERMKSALENEPLITLRQDECAQILIENGSVTGIRTALGAEYGCRACVICSGVYLNSRVHTGEYHRDRGPSGLSSATLLSDSLTRLGFELRRFKTGTPPRVKGSSLDYSRMQPQYGDEPIPHFSFMTDERLRAQSPCFLTYTNSKTHDIIRENLDRSPMFTGAIHATGTRYCPSIEDKIVRFAEKDRHQIFIEPEGLTTDEMYVQGLSTSLPRDVQEAMLRTIDGMENCVIQRYGYAIEYDCIDPTELNSALMSRRIPGLFFAGQINGSSGYEEAAAQGILAGINAALTIQRKAPVVLTRDMAYIGVMTDDLTTQGTDEPYRMMTSRAEYRLRLRQDNADLRLTKLSHDLGLASDERLERTERKVAETRELREKLSVTRFTPGPALDGWLKAHGQAPVQTGVSAEDLLRRPEITVSDVTELSPDLKSASPAAAKQAEIAVKYEGYLQREDALIRKAAAMEDTLLPEDTPYLSIDALRIEAREKLAAQKPRSLAAAGRIPGVNPADVAVLMVWLKKRNG